MAGRRSPDVEGVTPPPPGRLAGAGHDRRTAGTAITTRILQITAAGTPAIQTAAPRDGKTAVGRTTVIATHAGTDVAAEEAEGAMAVLFILNRHTTLMPITKYT
jgi:hypothetical protein